MAWDWLDTITTSWLHKHVTDNASDDRRPTIAVIDTGFDSQARFVDHKLKRRLGVLSGSNTQNRTWKDCWQSSACPQDEDGHGTAMLSIIHRIAPFANICVARIAAGDQDMKNDPEGTSNNLAKVLELDTTRMEFAADLDLVGYHMGDRGAKGRHYIPISGMGARAICR